MTKVSKGESIPAFDEGKLQVLTAPITVTVHQMKQGQPTRVSMPVKPGYDVEGKGWTHDECRVMDAFLEKYGPGLYHVIALGDNGEQFKWKVFHPTPAPAPGNGGPGITQVAYDGTGMAFGGAAQATQAAQQQPVIGWAPPPPAHQQYAAPQQQHQFYPQNPQGYPQQGYPQQGGYPQQQGGQQVYPPQGQSWQPWMSMPPPYPHTSPDLQQEREERLKLESRLEFQAMQSAHKEQMASLVQEMRRMGETVQKPQGESDEVKLLRMQLEEQKRQTEKNEVLSLIREMQASTQRQIDALMQLVNQRPTGPDPGISLLVEAQKAQAAAQLEASRMASETQKEIARLQTEWQKEAARSAIGPKEMLEFANRANQGHDALANGWARIIQAQQSAFENMMNAQGPQVSPAQQMLAEAAQGVLGVAGRYVEMKEKQSITTAQVQAMAIQARAGAMTPASNGAPALAGAPAETAGDQTGEATEAEGDEPQTDEDWFGEALAQVKQLRSAARAGVVSPEQAAEALIKGIDHFLTQGGDAEVPPAFELWPDNLVVLIEKLLPDAPTSFKEQTLQALANIAQETKKQMRARS